MHERGAKHTGGIVLITKEHVCVYYQEFRTSTTELERALSQSRINCNSAQLCGERDENLITQSTNLAG